MAKQGYQEPDPDVLALLPLDRINAEISRCLPGYQR
jgi:hypothetical protein